MRGGVRFGSVSRGHWLYRWGGSSGPSQAKAASAWPARSQLKCLLYVRAHIPVRAGSELNSQRRPTFRSILRKINLPGFGWNQCIGRRLL